MARALREKKNVTMISEIQSRPRTAADGFLNGCISNESSSVTTLCRQLKIYSLSSGTERELWNTSPCDLTAADAAVESGPHAIGNQCYILRPLLPCPSGKCKRKKKELT